MASALPYEALFATVVTTIFLLGIAIHILYIYGKYHKLKESIVSLSIASILMFLLFSIITMVVSSKDISHTFIAQDCVMHWIAPYFYAMGKIFLYLFILHRLNCLVDNSVVEMNSIFIRCLSICIFILLVTPNLMITAYIIKPINAINNDSFSYVTSGADCEQLAESYQTSLTNTLLHSGIYSFVAFDIFFSVFILRLYVSKLLILTLLFDEVNVLNIQDDEMSKKIVNRNAVFVETAMKIFNLTIFAILSSWFISVIHGISLGRHWLCIDIVVASATMYLSFNFSHKMYEMTFGKCCCNNCCFIFCTKLCCICCLQNKVPYDIQFSLGYVDSAVELPELSDGVGPDSNMPPTAELTPARPARALTNNEIYDYYKD